MQLLRTTEAPQRASFQEQFGQYLPRSFIPLSLRPPSFEIKSQVLSRITVTLRAHCCHTDVILLSHSVATLLPHCCRTAVNRRTWTTRSPRLMLSPKVRISILYYVLHTSYNQHCKLWLFCRLDHVHYVPSVCAAAYAWSIYCLNLESILPYLLHPRYSCRRHCLVHVSSFSRGPVIPL
jgi:hypothetical protein